MIIVSGHRSCAGIQNHAGSWLLVLRHFISYSTRYPIVSNLQCEPEHLNSPFGICSMLVVKPFILAATLRSQGPSHSAVAAADAQMMAVARQRTLGATRSSWRQERCRIGGRRQYRQRRHSHPKQDRQPWQRQLEGNTSAAAREPPIASDRPAARLAAPATRPGPRHTHV